MEIFGLLFAFPILFLVSRLYARKAGEWLEHNKFSAAVWSLPTGAVLLLACVEAYILVRFGAYQAEKRFGAGFHALHLIVFFLGAPAVANAALLVSQRLRISRKASITIANLLCFLAGVALLFTNIAVSEGIYGIDGTGVRPGAD